MEQDDPGITVPVFDLQRGIDASAFADGETVLRFSLPELDQVGRWWLICAGRQVDLCYEDPGKDVNGSITSPSGTLIEAGLGDVSLRAVVASDRFQMVGDVGLRRCIAKRFARSLVATTPRPAERGRNAAAKEVTIRYLRRGQQGRYRLQGFVAGPLYSSWSDTRMAQRVGYSQRWRRRCARVTPLPMALTGPACAVRG